MTTEERLLRLENAFATLAELAARQHERTDSLEQSHQILVQLVRNMDERMDQHLTWINQLGAESVNADVKIAALADAQIRADEARTNADAKIAALADAQIRTEASLGRLAEAQAQTDKRLDALIDIVREGRNGKS